MGLFEAIDSCLLSETLIDHRVDGWLFMSSTKPIILIILAYLLMIYCGLKWMKNRERYDIRTTMVIYNVTVATLYGYVIIQLLLGVIRRRYNWICEPVNHDAVEVEEMRIVKAMHLYFISKLMELFDTLIYILRKNRNQFDLVHVYHHVVMATGSWMATRWTPSGSMFFVPMINGATHFFVYLSFGLTIMGPKVIEYIWWKKHLGTILIVQYTLVITQGSVALMTGCSTARLAHYCIVAFFASVGYQRMYEFYQKLTSKSKESFDPSFVKFLNGIHSE